MDIKKLAPWNWFKKEEEASGAVVPVRRTDDLLNSSGGAAIHPIVQLQREMDRLFENAFHWFGFPMSRMFTPLTDSGLLKPQVDIGASDREYTITVEVPGVDEKDMKIEITNDTMIIRGEKKQEKEEKDKNYYRVERSYGSFQRILSLPGDVDQDEVKATFKNGVLTIRMPRKALPKSEVRQVEIR